MKSSKTFVACAALRCPMRGMLASDAMRSRNFTASLGVMAGDLPCSTEVVLVRRAVAYRLHPLHLGEHLPKCIVAQGESE